MKRKPTKKTRQLPTKQEIFVAMLMKVYKGEVPWMTPTDIAEKVYGCKTRKKASAIASAVIKREKITFDMMMDMMGLTDEEDINDLIRLRKIQKIVGSKDDFVEVDDGPTQLKALELTQKLKGRLKKDDDKDDGKDSTKLTIVVKPEQKGDDSGKGIRVDFNPEAK